MSDNTQKAKDAVHDLTNDVKDAVHDLKNNVKDTAHNVKNDIKDAAHDAKNDAKDAAHDAENDAKDAAREASATRSQEIAGLPPCLMFGRRQSRWSVAGRAGTPYGHGLGDEKMKRGLILCLVVLGALIGFGVTTSSAAARGHAGHRRTGRHGAHSNQIVVS